MSSYIHDISELICLNYEFMNNVLIYKLYINYEFIQYITQL